MIDVRVLFGLYTIFTIILILTHVILKCKFNNHFLDQFVYLDDKGNIYKYIFFHVITYFITGVLFGNQIFIPALVKTIIVESLLVAMKNCSIHKIDNIYSAAVSIVIGMISYSIGGLFHPYIVGVLIK